MAKVSISEGAKLAGVSRSTLNRHLKDGAISKHRDNSGRPFVDTSELLRFYGELSQENRTEQDTVGQHRTAQNGQYVSELERRLLAAEAALDLERVRRESEEEQRSKAEEAAVHWRTQAERLTLLLSDQRGQQPPWWQRAFGKRS